MCHVFLHQGDYQISSIENIKPHIKSVLIKLKYASTIARADLRGLSWSGSQHSLINCQAKRT